MSEGNIIRIELDSTLESYDNQHPGVHINQLLVNYFRNDRIKVTEKSTEGKYIIT